MTVSLVRPSKVYHSERPPLLLARLMGSIVLLAGDCRLSSSVTLQAGGRAGRRTRGRSAAAVSAAGLMWGLALADFGRDPRSSDSLRGISFFFKKRKNCLQNFQVFRYQSVVTLQ